MTHTSITIEGMSCAACVNRIESALKKQQLVKDIRINLISKTATITLDSTQTLPPILHAITKLGYQVSTSPTFTSAFTPALSPAQSAALAPTSAATSASSSVFSAATPTMLSAPRASTQSRVPTQSLAHSSVHTPTHSSAQSHTSRIYAHITHYWHAFNELDKRLLPPKVRIVLSGVCAALLLYLSMLPMIFHFNLVAPFDDRIINFYTQIVLALCSMHCAREYYFRGFKTLFSMMPTMDSLIAISTSSAFLYSIYNGLLGGADWYFESVGVIVFFILLGKSLEQSAKDKTNAVINALLYANPTQVVRVDSTQTPHTHTAHKNSKQENPSTEQIIASDAICIGDMLRILPGQRVPVDGIMLDEYAELDESMLSGESLPVSKKANDTILAGSINTNKAFLMRSTSTSEHSTLSSITALVAQAMNSKPAIARLADIIASIFVPAVILLACVSLGVWYMLEGAAFGFMIGISTLVISCPCALGLATPMSVMIGTALANKQGIFVAQAQSFERLCKATHIIFDKTGTLTQNALQVTRIISRSSLSEQEILAYSASLEKGSEHLIAKAILTYHQAQSARHAAQAIQTAQATTAHSPLSLDFTHFHAHAGLGIEARLDSTIYALGNREFFAPQATSTIESSLESQKHTKHIGLQVFLARKPYADTHAQSTPSQQSAWEILGEIHLQDTLKPHAKHTIQTLKKMGFTLHILSGDNAANTAHIAQSLQISHYHSNAKPQEKLAYLQALQDKGEVVLMIGDGINDVGALMAADISLSFGSASDVSKNAADIVIYHDDIRKILSTLQLSRGVLRNMKENLAFAFVYNALCIPIACGVLYYPLGIVLNPMIAAFAMSASSLCVVLNSQRLWRLHPRLNTQNHRDSLTAS